MSQCINHTRECLYQIFDVSRSVDNDELKAAYKQQTKQWKSDKNINDIEAAPIRLKQINEAFSILSDNTRERGMI